MKKRKIFLFGDGNIIFFIFLGVIVLGLGIGLLWLPGEDSWIVMLVICIPSGLIFILAFIFLLFGFSSGYIIRNNDKIEVYALSGKKLRSYFLGDLYEVSVRKLCGNPLTRRYDMRSKYIFLYFSEKSKQETKDVERCLELWKTKEIIPVIYAKQYMMQLREMLGEEVWKEKYKE